MSGWPVSLCAPWCAHLRRDASPGEMGAERTGRDEELPLALGQLQTMLGGGKCDFDLSHIWLETICSSHGCIHVVATAWCCDRENKVVPVWFANVCVALVEQVLAVEVKSELFFFLGNDRSMDIPASRYKDTPRQSVSHLSIYHTRRARLSQPHFSCCLSSISRNPRVQQAIAAKNGDFRRDTVAIASETLVRLSSLQTLSK